MKVNNLPVFIEPVVDLGLDVQWVSEVRGAGRSDPVHISISSQQVVGQFFVSALVVLLTQSKVASSLAYSNKALNTNSNLSPGKPQQQTAVQQCSEFAF